MGVVLRLSCDAGWQMQMQRRATSAPFKLPLLFVPHRTLHSFRQCYGKTLSAPHTHRFVIALLLPNAARGAPGLCRQVRTLSKKWHTRTARNLGLLGRLALTTEPGLPIGYASHTFSLKSPVVLSHT